MMIALHRLFEYCLLPPGGVLGLLLAAFALRRHRRISRWLACTAAALLYLASIPAATAWLARQVQTASPADPAWLWGQAIVVLGAGRSPDAPEYGGGGDTLSQASLQRVRYAAWLHRRSGLPILVSGGKPYGEAVPEAALMAKVLVEEFGVSTRWIQGDSDNTEQDAAKSASVLRQADVEALVLVTDAWHMGRAVDAFARYGLRVQPAPTGFYRVSADVPDWLRWVPTAEALHETQRGLHEYLGRVWYWLRYRG